MENLQVILKRFMRVVKSRKGLKRNRDVPSFQPAIPESCFMELVRELEGFIQANFFAAESVKKAITPLSDLNTELTRLIRITITQLEISWFAWHNLAYPDGKAKEAWEAEKKKLPGIMQAYDMLSALAMYDFTQSSLREGADDGEKSGDKTEAAGSGEQQPDDPNDRSGDNTERLHDPAGKAQN